jgi:hypothetical protein
MYVAAMIVLNNRPVIRDQSVTGRGRFLVGYFASIDAINDQGGPIDLADLLIRGWLGHSTAAAVPGQRTGPAMRDAISSPLVAIPGP